MIPRFQGLVTVNFIQKDYSLQNRTFDDCFFRNISTLNYSICDRNEDLYNITNMILRQSSDCFVQYNENEIFKRLISNYLKLFVNKNFFVSLFSLVFSQTIEIMYFRKKKTTRLPVENKTLLSLLMNVTLLGQISHSNTSRPTVKVTSCEILLKVGAGVHVFARSNSFALNLYSKQITLLFQKAFSCIIEECHLKNVTCCSPRRKTVERHGIFV